MTLYRRGESWYYDFIVKGQRFGPKSFGPVTRTLAKELYNKKRVEALQQANGIYRPKDTTFEALLIQFFVWHEPRVRPSTHLRNVAKGKHFLRSFGAHKLSVITSKTIGKYYDDRLTKVSLGTVANELILLQTVFNWARQRHLIEHDPMSGIELPRLRNGRLRWLTHKEEQRILEACNAPFRPVVVTALHTGMRRNELLQLRWGDVDFNERVITVRADNAKTGRTRVIPISPTLYATLTQVEPSAHQREDHVFIGSKGPYKNIGNHWNTIVKRAKVPDFRFHDLRHTFASRLAMRGVPLKVIQELLGHESINMTMRYAHLADENLKRAIQMLDSQHYSQQSDTDMMQELEKIVD